MMGETKTVTAGKLEAILRRPEVARAMEYARLKELRERASAGGLRRAANMTPAERRASARAAAVARWARAKRRRARAVAQR